MSDEPTAGAPPPAAQPGPGEWLPPAPQGPEHAAQQAAADGPVRPPRATRHIVLFVLTLLTATYWGFLQYQLFYFEDLDALALNPFADPMLLIAGAPYGLAVIAFLLAHEMGHYLACRYYRIDATLPYFIPVPPVPPFVLLPGTMGAVIRILSPLRSRRALFDVAIAGPLAGFVVALPILAVGLSLSRPVELAALGAGTYEMGEPLIWGPLQTLFGPPLAADQTLIAHPLAFVGWFALLVTAMNLLPVGQLDGGHLLYAVFPRIHRQVSLAIVACMAYAGFRYFSGWIFFALLVMFVIGTRHPKPARFEQTLGPVRLLLLLLTALIFATSFMLVPIRIDLPL